MAKPTENKPELKQLVIERSFSAPRRLLFEAWSSADHIKRWFCPKTYTTPEAEIDFRAGGVFTVCMRAPDGTEHFMRGRFTHVAPYDRLAFVADVEAGGKIGFSTETIVTFADDISPSKSAGSQSLGSKLTVRQTYDIYDPVFEKAVEGARQGWSETLDKLEREVASMQTSQARAASHSTFRLQRDFRAPPDRVFHALTNAAAKARWFSGGADWECLERVMDATPGGRERVVGRWTSGVVTSFDAVYLDVVADRRIVYAYEMHKDDAKISVSLATLELTPTEDGTRLAITEQGAFLDGYDDAGSREEGTGHLLESLRAAVEL